MKKKVLLTGGLGFFGSHIAQILLADGYEVSILTKSKKGLFRLKNRVRDLKIIHLDILDEKKLIDVVKEFGIVIHAAGISRGTMGRFDDNNDPISDIELNSIGTLNLLNAIVKNKTNPRIVFISSTQVYGNPEKLPVDEDSPTNPISLSVATKLSADHFCKIYADIFNLDIIIARVTNIYGPFESITGDEKIAINLMIKKAVQNQELTLFDYGKPVYRDYLFVGDAAKAILVLVKFGTKSEIYNVSTNNPITLESIFTKIVSVVNSGSINKIIPDQHILTSGVQNFYASNEKLLKLGWSPEIAMESGIEITAKFYRSINELI